MLADEDSFFKPPDMVSVKNSGQRLLRSLNRPKQTTSKIPFILTQSTLRDTQLEPKHAMASDMTVFGQPTAEVRGLFADIHPVPVDLPGLRELNESKKNRQDAAWKLYLSRRAACFEQLIARVERRTRAFREYLNKSTASLDEEYEGLEDDRLMRLSELGVRSIWSFAERSLSDRTAELASYRKAIDDAENYWRVDNEKVLTATLRALMDVSYLSEGQIERLLEAEVLELNRQALDRRRTAADLIKRLQVHEVEEDRRRRRTWEEGLARWRGLRTQHAINTFNARIRSPEFSDPEARAEILRSCCGLQQKYYEGVMKRLVAVKALMPPSLSLDSVGQWYEETEAVLEEWRGELGGKEAELAALEGGLEERARGLLQELRAEVMEYGSIRTPSECDALFAAEVEPVLQERSGAAQALMMQACEYLEYQRGERARQLHQVGDYVRNLAEIHETERHRVLAMRQRTAHAMEVTTDHFEEASASREASLAAAVTEVQQGAGESDLDAKVAASIRILEEIEQSYRDFHTAMSDTVGLLPSDVKGVLQDYYKDLLSTLQIKKKERWESVDSKPTIRDGPTPVLKSLSKRSLGSRKSSATALDQIMQPAQPPPNLIKTRKGNRYDFVSDLYDRVFAPPTPPKPAPPPPKSQEEEEEVEEEEAGPPSPPPEPAPKGTKSSRASTAQASDRPSSKSSGRGPAGADSRRASAAVSDLGDKARRSSAVAGPDPPIPEGSPPPEDDAFPPPPPPPPAPLVPAGPPTPPLAADGITPLLLDLPIRPEPLRHLLAHVQECVISDFELYQDETAKSVQQWSEQQDLALTEALDANLRRLRPRAGRIEEEIRQLRSVELMGQKRKVDAHLRQLARTFRNSGGSFDDSQRSEEDSLKKLVARLENQTQLLFLDMSTKSVDIRCREAAASRGHFERLLTAACERLKRQADDEKAKLMAINAKFDSEVLKGFPEGGRFDEVNLMEHRRRLEEANAAVERQRLRQHQAVDDMRDTLLAAAAAAVQSVNASAPVHKEDLALIEALDAAMASTRTKARRLFEESAAQEEKIKTLLGRLVAAVKTQGEGRTPYELCQEIVEGIDQLRLELAKRGRSLQCLKKGLVLSVTPIRASVAAEGHEADGPLVEGEDEEEEEEEEPVPKGKFGKMAPPPAKAPPPAPKPAAKGAAQPPAEPSGPPADSMYGLVHSLIEECHMRCEEVATGYYSRRDPNRAITRPKRIPEALDQLRDINNTFLDDIRAQLKLHVQTSSHRYKEQVVDLARVLLPLPAVALDLLSRHELGAHEGKVKEIDAEFFKRREALQKQLLKNRAAMKPSIAIPSMRKEVEKLISEESRRTDRAVAAIKDRAKETMYELAVRAAAAQRRMVELSRQLAKMFDQLVMPEDLESTPGRAGGMGGGGGAAGAAGPAGSGAGHTSDGSDMASHRPSSSSGGAAGAASTGARMNIKQLKRLAIAQAQSAGQETPGTLEGRTHFQRRLWVLPEGRLRVGESGWEEEDDDLVGGLDLMEEDEDTEVVFAKERDRKLTAVDTPAQRAVVRAYGSSMEALEESVRSMIAQVKTDLAAALEEQDLIRINFNKLANSICIEAGLAVEKDEEGDDY